MKTKTMKTILAAMILVVIATISTSAYACGEGSEGPWYSDVPESHEYYSAIKEMADRGVVSPAEYFRPDAPCTLREAIVMEERMFGIHPTITSWSDWTLNEGSEYALRNGPMTIMGFHGNYTTETSSESVLRTLFYSVPFAKDRHSMHDLSCVDILLLTEPDHRTFNSLYVYGLFDKPWQAGQADYITRGQFADLLLKAESLLPCPDYTRILKDETVMDVYLYGYGEGETLEDTPLGDRIKEEVLYNIAYLDPELQTAIDNDGWKVIIVNDRKWNEVEFSHDVEPNTSSGLCSNYRHCVFVPDSSITFSLCHEFGHCIHFMADNEEQQEYIYNNFVDEIADKCFSDYCRTNINECFAEAFDHHVRLTEDKILDSFGDIRPFSDELVGAIEVIVEEAVNE